MIESVKEEGEVSRLPSAFIKWKIQRQVKTGPETRFSVLIFFSLLNNHTAIDINLSIAMRALKIT